MENFTNALYEVIGRRIKELRNKMNLNQEELALKIGMGRASISNIELGRSLPGLRR
jgi:transcriptional regulator with XRE-family HTH domain